MMSPRPWREVDSARLRVCVGVLTDIDDTLTRDGRIEATALAALRDLEFAAVPVIAITGRPIGWSETVASTWPVAAIVAENGGVAMVRDAHGAWLRRCVQDAATRAANTRRMRDVQVRILRELPHATMARDSAGRVTDIAVDHAEFATLDAAGIERVVAIMRSEGMQATVSSIHVNGWYGDHDKWGGACWIVEMLYGRSLEDEHAAWVYVGDSTNDQVMFARFGLSVGVANLRRFAAELALWPCFITDGERGEGFAEVAHAVLAARAQRDESAQAAR
jgi:HAD superfamily hydrolase (TIGR01484 family)